MGSGEARTAPRALRRAHRDGSHRVVLDEEAGSVVTDHELHEVGPVDAGNHVRDDHRVARLSEVEREPLMLPRLVRVVLARDALAGFENAGERGAIHGADVSPHATRRQVPVALPLLVASFVAAGCGGPHLRAARRAFDEGAYERAAREYRVVAEERPADAEIWDELARSESLAERPDRAREAYEVVARLRPADPQPWIEIGITHELERAYDRALEAYLRAMAVAPDDPFPARFTGTRLLRWGQADAAIGPLERATTLDPSDEDGWNALALARYHSGDPDGSIATFRRGLEHVPGSRTLELGLAAALVNTRRFEEALAVYDGVIARDPRFAAAHVGRALLLDELGRRDEALAAFRRAVEVADDPVPYEQRLRDYRALRGL